MVSSQRYKSRYEFIHLLHYNNSHHFAQFILTPSYSVITVEQILESHLSLSHIHTHTHTHTHTSCYQNKNTTKEQTVLSKQTSVTPTHTGICNM